MTTKFEILQEYKKESNVKVVATWQLMGGRRITAQSNTDHYTPATNFFSKDSLYLLAFQEEDMDRCPLYHSLIFCLEDTYGEQDWYNFELLNPFTGECSFGNSIISPSFRLVLEAKDTCSVFPQDIQRYLKDYKEQHNGVDFVPFQNTSKKTGEVQISELDYQNCIKCLGYPFITEEELEYPRQDILNLAIKPALEEYFHWLPRTRIEEVPVTGQVQLIPFPSDAYDICGIQVQQRGTHGAGSIQHPLWRFADESAYGSFNTAGLTGTYRGPNRPHTNVSSMTNFIDQRAVSQAVTNLNTRVHYDKVYLYQDGAGNIYEDLSTVPAGKSVKEAPALRVYSNKLGNFNIHWAIHSLNFDDVIYEQRQNMFKYCQAEVMLLFANLRRQARSDIPGAIDYSGWITEANTMKQEVVTEWKQLVKASLIMRGSL